MAAGWGPCCRALQTIKRRRFTSASQPVDFEPLQGKWPGAVWNGYLWKLHGEDEEGGGGEKSIQRVNRRFILKALYPPNHPLAPPPSWPPLFPRAKMNNQRRRPASQIKPKSRLHLQPTLISWVCAWPQFNVRPPWLKISTGGGYLLIATGTTGSCCLID